MAKRIDLAGVRFGRLVAIRDVGSKRNFRLWEFLCDCGAVVERTTAAVRHGGTTSCGCLQREETSRRRSPDITGQRFGRLTALHRVGADKNGHVRWQCSCECGNRPIIAAVALRKGTKSCGCLQREVAAETQRSKALPQEQKLASIKRNAAKQRERRKTDPTRAMQARISRLHRHALAQVGAIKSSPTFEELGYTVDAFVAHIERQFQKGMGWHNMRDWQIDHIVPISSARSKDDVIALNQLSNLRPMWAKENNAKKAKRVSLL